MNNHRDNLYNTAIAELGRDASPADRAPDELACAESVSRIVRLAMPEINFPSELSTRDLLMVLTNSPSFVSLDVPMYGCIIISATGTGNGKVANGHTGIVGKHASPDGTLWIMSNDSRNGLWGANYTLRTWKQYYELRGGMPTHFFLPR